MDAFAGDYREGRVFFLWFEVSWMIAAAVCGALRPRSSVTCFASIGVALFCSFGFVAAQLVFRPYRTRMALCIAVTFELLVAGALGMSAVAAIGSTGGHRFSKTRDGVAVFGLVARIAATSKSLGDLVLLVYEMAIGIAEGDAGRSAHRQWQGVDNPILVAEQNTDAVDDDEEEMVESYVPVLPPQIGDTPMHFSDARGVHEGYDAKPTFDDI